MYKLLHLLVSAIIIPACASFTEAQQPSKVKKLGILYPASPSAGRGGLNAFQQRLRELGYVEGKNIIIEYRYAEGKLDTLPRLADELVRLNVDVIVTSSSPAIRAAKDMTKTIPIVFATATDPVGDGIVSSLARPGGNVTGLVLLAPELNGKRLELLKEAFPKITRVAFLTRGGASIRFKDAETVAKALGLQLHELGVKGPDDFESAFDVAKNTGVQALTASPNPFLNAHRPRIIDLANKNHLPAMYVSSEWVEAGGFMSYGPDNRENWRGAAVYVDKILKGRKPADLPVEQPMKFEFVINLKAAKQIGLTIPPNLLARADKIIR